MDAQLIEACAHLISALAWPLVVVVGMTVYWRPLQSLIAETDSFKILGAEYARKKVDEQLRRASEEATHRIGLSKEPTPHELERAEMVAEISKRAQSSIIRQEAIRLATEYESVRASLPSGEDRTRKMEAVMAKMRAVGSAVFPLRHEFMDSASPGFRLVAIASMQISPDYEALDWLVDRVQTEKPFVGYHAAVALNAAAKNEKAVRHRPVLEGAVSRMAEIARSLPTDSDRADVIRDTLETLEALRK